jgi:hypothetical protein
MDDRVRVERERSSGRGARGLVVLALALAAVLAALAGVAVANHSVLQHISAGEINGNGAFVATFAGASADGTRVFFATDEQLVPGDTDSSQDIYERSAGTTKRVSAGQVNDNGAFDAAFEGASADGSRVFFATDEQLVTNDHDTFNDIYERSGGTTKLVSAGQINGNGAFDANFAGASSDGARVFFHTDERLVSSDTDGVQDVYQRSGGTTRRVSVGQINGNGAFGSLFQGASADGTRVFFITLEQLASGDTDNSFDVYERSAGTTKQVSAGQINGNGAFGAFFVGASNNGTRVFFETSEKLASADTDASRDVYERSAGTTTRISSGNGAFAATFRGASADGTTVFFETDERLVSGDTDNSTDAYQRSAGTTRRVSAGQINGNGAFPADFQGASDDGTRVFFETAERLVSSDNDSGTDVYERSGGTTKRVSAGQINGNTGTAANFSGASADGTRVFFATFEQLVPSDGDGFGLDVYERAAGETSLISPGDDDHAAVFAGSSVDGSAVFFETQEPVLASDEDFAVDVYGAYLAP